MLHGTGWGKEQHLARHFSSPLAVSRPLAAPAQCRALPSRTSSSDSHLVSFESYEEALAVYAVAGRTFAHSPADGLVWFWTGLRSWDNDGDAAATLHNQGFPRSMGHGLSFPA